MKMAVLLCCYKRPSFDLITKITSKGTCKMTLIATQRFDIMFDGRFGKKVSQEENQRCK